MADATDPKVPDPQSLVDAALGTAPATPPAPPVAPAPAFEPAVKVEVVPEPEPPTVAVRDDTPLAFMTPPSSAPVTSTEPPVVPPTPEQPAYMSPSPMMSAPVAEKRGGKTGKMIGVIVGLVLLIGGVVGGYAYYRGYLVTPKMEPAVIASIEELSRDECGGCVRGGKLVWQGGRCTMKGTCEGDTPPDNGIINPAKKCSPTLKVGDDGAFCGGCVNKCVSWADLGSTGCNEYVSKACKTPIIYGANGTLTDDLSKCSIKGCQCGGYKYCFDKTGICNQAEASAPGSNITGTNYNQMGLCAMEGSYSQDGNFFQPDMSNWTNTGCTDSNCSTSDSQCVIVRYTCNETRTGVSCTQNEERLGQSGGFKGTCGKVEQLDIMCNGQYVTSRTRINPPCQDKPKDTPTPSPSASVAPPTLACIGLTKDKPDTEIVIGSNLQFTCSGASAPIGAVSPLTYNFRLRIDSGAWQSLSATGDKANYTVAAEGDYDVECRVCGTIGSANVCSPTWTGVTP